VGTGAAYTLSLADNGHTIVLVANAASPGRTASAQSLPLTVQFEPVPQATMAPAITGIAARTSVLHVSAGQWINNPDSLAYQWQHCDSAGGSCHDIDGATGTSYTLSRPDEHYTISVRVTATNSTGSGVASAQPTAEVAPVPPAVTHAPVVQGTPQQGGVLTEGQDAWQTTADTSYTRVWQRCASDGNACQNIGGATGSSYHPVAADVGYTLKVLVSAANVDGTLTSASAASAVVSVAAPRWRTLPTISAPNAKVGTALTIKPGTWTGPNVDSDTVEVMRCLASCKAVSSASDYTIVGADLGSILRLRETASNGGGSTAVWSAQYVGPVVSTNAGTSVLSATRAVAVKSTSGQVLATAQMQGATTSAVHKKAPARKVIVRRAPKATGTLRAWVCPVLNGHSSGPMPACTGKVKLPNSARGRKTIKVPASMGRKVRIVVVRSAR
jgi:hypothetical protein